MFGLQGAMLGASDCAVGGLGLLCIWGNHSQIRFNRVLVKDLNQSYHNRKSCHNRDFHHTYHNRDLWSIVWFVCYGNLN